MTAHTIGPWDYSTRTENDILINVRIDDGSHATVCTVHGSTSPMNDQYVGASKLTANTRLICAAPDLLAALQAITNSGPDAIPIKEAFEMAHRAIERATGGSA